MSSKRRNALIASALLIFVLALGLLLRACLRQPAAGPPPASPTPSPTFSPSPTPSPTPRPSPSPTATKPAGITELAHLPEEFESFAKPGDEAGEMTTGDWWGYPLIVPIIDKNQGFLQVRLPWRPNESTTWVREEGLEITTTPYRLEVSVTQYRVRLFFEDNLRFEVPAGVGVDSTPTPKGHFYITMFAPGPSAGYGEEVIALSAHSETITNWQGSGDAITAIHGPLGADAIISDGGGQFTNGCIRVLLTDLERLVVVPVGTPVDIID
ncbi:MAG: L,D-transpeptidase [Micrococcales bacterium]|nr:L,D-transpeptidase [Micrococcales bacterium]